MTQNRLLFRVNRQGRKSRRSAEIPKLEGKMKKQTLATLSISILLLLLTAASVPAQSQRSKVVEIPFPFIVSERTLPPGYYTIEPNRRDVDLVWKIRSTDNRNSALFMTISARSENQETGKLVFQRYGETYFLSQIWTPGGNSGRELVLSHRERELARDAGQRAADTVVALDK